MGEGLLFIGPRSDPFPDSRPWRNAGVEVEPVRNDDHHAKNAGGGAMEDKVR